MVWLAWRQFRSQAALAAALAVAIVVTLVATRGHVVDTYSVAGTGDLTGFYVWVRLLGTVLIGVPAFLGAFWGAPLLAREFETHTYRMTWMQSITRNRWLTMRLAVIGLVTVVFAAVFGLMFTWWAAPLDASGSRIAPANFGQRGIVPIGYALFGVALGTLAGTIIRRTLPAMATTLVAFFVVRIGVQELLRPHLLGTRLLILPMRWSGGDNGGAWVLSTRVVDAAGKTLDPVALENTLTRACNITRATPDVDGALGQCARDLGIHRIARAHPSSQFWSLQACELGVFVALAAVTLGVGFWWLNRRAT